MNVRFCPSCRSLILADFRYCPYCGEPVALKGPGLSETLEDAFVDLDGKGGSGKAQGGAPRNDVFANAQASLERLEADMDLLIDELEKEGRSPK
jgi:hypothetical protein